MLVNGVPSDSISAYDRGFNYGDGVFRTLTLRQSTPLHWKQHYLKLAHDCHALDLSCPPAELLHDEIISAASGKSTGVVKIMITRGASARGYAIPTESTPNRIVRVDPMPDYPAAYADSGVQVGICQTRLARQSRLAGIKHLNRLENVLAASEAAAQGAAEGLMLDEAGWVISGTRSNLFAVKGNRLYTPDLSDCGVAGVQRQRVLYWAKKSQQPCEIIRMQVADLYAMDELFLVNSVIGLWPIARIGEFSLRAPVLAYRIQHALTDEND